jgi:hypothetical protein
MTRPTVTHVIRRAYGLPRHIYVTRCPTCRWHTEARELHTAAVLGRFHECPKEAA